MIDRRMFLPGLALLLAGAGCAASSTFPVVTDNLEVGEMGYYVCEGADNERIYEKSSCGDDSCFSSYFNADGVILEANVEYGPGSGRMEPETQTTNCQRTTEAYFTSQVQE
jgi:hypothetical protein